MPGELVHFDIPVDDVEKMVAFYRNVMGWKIEKYGGEGFPDYWMVQPEPGKEGAAEGGIGKKGMPEQKPMNYYRTDDLDTFNQKVRDNGGTVVMEKMPVKGFGWMSVNMDPEGNPFGGWVDDENAG